MIDLIIDFITNNAIATAITVIIGFGTIIGYIFRAKFKSKIVVSVKFFISIILSIAPYGIVKLIELIESNKKILKLREECIKEIESSIKPMQQVFSVGIEKMSKSKKNVVAPTEIFEKYGADAARMFILSDTPYEKEFEWTDAGVKSVHKYLQRVWALACTATEQSGVENQEMIKQMHRFLSAYIGCFERFEFNVAIAKLREFTNFLSGLDYADKNNSYTLGVVMKNVAIVFCPICPHMCEAMWQLLGGEGLCCQQKLPEVDAKHLEETTMQVSIAVNGKFKVCITLDKNLEEQAIIDEAKKQDKVANALAGKEIKKTIVANSKTGKMVNFVVG